MTPEERALELLRGTCDNGICGPADIKNCNCLHAFTQAIQEAVDEEREVCATLADVQGNCYEVNNEPVGMQSARGLATAIRSRGGQE